MSRQTAREQLRAERPRPEVRGMWPPVHVCRELVIIWEADGVPYGLLIDGTAYRVRPVPRLPLRLGTGDRIQTLYATASSPWWPSPPEAPEAP